MRKQDLPIDGVIPEIVASLEKTNSVVIEAAPGAGKTTRVPVAIDRAEVTDGRMVVVLQPRRVAARAAARRIAWENGWRLGDEVGYHVRFDRKAGPTTRILVVTEGIFISMLQRDPFMELDRRRRLRRVSRAQPRSRHRAGHVATGSGSGAARPAVGRHVGDPRWRPGSGLSRRLPPHHL